MTIGVPVSLGATSAAAGSATLVLTTTADAPVGTLIVVAVGYKNNGAISSVSDSAGNTYTGNTQTSSSNGSIRLFWTIVATDLPQGGTITATYSATANNKLLIAANVSGIAASPADATVGATGTGTAPSVTSGTLNAAAATAGEIVFGVGEAAASETWSAEGGFTALATVNQSTTSSLHLAYQTVNATTALTYAPTINTSAIWVAQIQGFIGAAASTGRGFSLFERFTYLEF